MIPTPPTNSDMPTMLAATVVTGLTFAFVLTRLGLLGFNNVAGSGLGRIS